jgi:homoserine O-acetyltransferase
MTEHSGPPATDNTAKWPTPIEGRYSIPNFSFYCGAWLPELRIRYQTLGQKREDENGQTTNAVLVMHGTGGSGDQFLNDMFAGELFNPGQPLDASKYFIILRDAIGHGGSSKPSDGLRAQFPKYGYRDMIRADYELLTAHLGVNHMRLVMGTSMGGMHSWLWAGLHPDFVDAAMPLASLPTEIAGRNRMSRKMIIDAIRQDPQYKGGNYRPTEQPVHGLRAAQYILTWMSSVPLQWQRDNPDRASADAFLAKRISGALETADANDMVYYVAASEDYDPRPVLDKITSPLVAVNSADDQVNPPELGILEEGIKKVKRGRAVVLPISEETRGHGSHTKAVLWRGELVRLLEESGGQL